MNANQNVLNHIQKHDTAVAMALYCGIGNYALSGLVSAATARVYEIKALERDPENDKLSIDERNEKDDSASDERDPPVGMEPRATAQDRVKFFGPLYANCVEYATELGGTEYDLPQTIESHIDWRAGMPAKDAEKAKRGTLSVEEALRLVTAARAQQQFWRESKGDVVEIAKGATENEYAAALLELEGVEAVQGMIKGYSKVMDRIGFRKTSPYFTSKGVIGQELRSEVGAMEAALPVIEAFIEVLERAYAPQIMAAINAGRNLQTLDSQAEAVAGRQKERLARILSDIEADEKAELAKLDAALAGDAKPTEDKAAA